MLCDGRSHPCAPTLPGLEHLSAKVKDWDAAVQTLSFTSATIVESIGAAASPAQTCTSTPAPERDGLPRFPAPPSTPRPTLEVISAAQLKPGRLFIVANLRGAYYTLVELLSRHKFDFRSDNLMHLGNLVAPPAPLLAMMMMQPQTQPQPLPSHATAAATAGGAAAASGGGGGGAASVGRNTAPLLKLMRRHGGLGPMGANECLTLLAAARANRQRVEDERRLQQEQLQQLQMQLKVQPGAAASRFQGRCSALSLQLAAAAASAAPLPTPQPALGCDSLGQRAAPPAAQPAAAAGSSSSSDSDSDDSDSSACTGSDAKEGLVGGFQTTRCRGDPVPVSPACAPPSPLPALPAPSPSPSPRWGSGGGGGGGRVTGWSAGGLDDADLAHLMSMPASILVQPYGILLQHAGPGDPAAGASVGAGAGRYHVIFSHRRAAAAAGAGAAAGAADGASPCTGLSSCRDVVRCAVLPPLRTLQRRSSGFAARVAGAGAIGPVHGMVAGLQVAGAFGAPSREELMMEVVEEPLSELDLPPPPVTSVPTGF